MNRRRTLVTCIALSVLAGACSSGDGTTAEPTAQSPEDPGATTALNDDEEEVTTTTEVSLPTDPVRVAGDEITPLQGGIFHNSVEFGMPWLPGPLEQQVGVSGPLFLEPARLTTTQLGVPVTFSVPEAFTLNHEWPGIVALLPGDAEGLIDEAVLLLMRPTDLFDPATQTDFPPDPGRAVATLEPTVEAYESWFETTAALEAAPTTVTVDGVEATAYDITVDRDGGQTWFCDGPGVGCLDWAWTRSCLCGNIAFKTDERYRVWIVPVEGQPPLVFFASALTEEFDDHLTWAQPIIDSITLGDPAPPVDDPTRIVAPGESLPEGTYTFPALDDMQLALPEPLEVFQHLGSLTMELPDRDLDGLFGLTRIVRLADGSQPSTVDDVIAGLRFADVGEIVDVGTDPMLNQEARVFDIGSSSPENFDGAPGFTEPPIITADVPDTAGARFAVGYWFFKPTRIWLVEHNNEIWMVSAQASPDDQPSTTAYREAAQRLFTNVELP